METIAAIATPLIKSALGIIRVSGDDCFEIVQKLFNQDILNKPSRRILVGKLLTTKEKKLIDEVVLLQYVSPKSYTGENMVEIISHGSVLVMNDILSNLIKSGARLAQNGEFSMRAVLNQKITMNKAEAINDFINCTSETGVEIIKKSFDNKVPDLLITIKDELENLVSNIEVNFDYPEYKDIEEVSKTKIVKTADRIRSLIKSLIDESTINSRFVYGVKVAIVGKPNVGKSTLLNALVGEERAITSNISGTTRDVISCEKTIKGVPFIFYDTAGLRKTKNKIEKKGIKFAKDVIEKADLILFVYEKDIKELTKSNPGLEKYFNKGIFVKNKSDLTKNRNSKTADGVCCISAKQGEIKELINSIFLKLEIGKAKYQKSNLYNARQIGILESVFANLNEIQTNLNKLTMDLISEKLNESYKQILDLLGLTFDEELSKNIFKNFCVGK